MTPSIRSVSYQSLLEKLCEPDTRWVILFAINFEECSVAFCRDVIQTCCLRRTSHIQLVPFRLTSSRATPWSALEVIKRQLERQVSSLCQQARLPFGITGVEYPATFDAAEDLLDSARRKTDGPPKLIVDLSAVPRELAQYLTDALLGFHTTPWLPNFQAVYLVHTPAARLTNRGALGPFSVGALRGVYSPRLLRNSTSSSKVSGLVFLGNEGFEAKLAIDTLSPHHAKITVAVNCFDGGLPRAVEMLISNLAVVADATEGVVDLQYYYSETDALRIALSAVNGAVHLCEEFPDMRHVFVTAPFGPKWAVALGSIASEHFREECHRRAPNAHIAADTLLLASSQYVGLYSRGFGVSHIMEWAFA